MNWKKNQIIDRHEIQFSSARDVKQKRTSDYPAIEETKRNQIELIERWWMIFAEFCFSIKEWPEFLRMPEGRNWNSELRRIGKVAAGEETLQENR